MKRTILVICALWCLTSLQAQTRESHWDTMGVSLGKAATLELGDQLNLVNTWTFGKGEALLMPTLEQYSQGELLALSQHIDTTMESDGRTTLRQVVVMTSFELGEHVLTVGTPAAMADTTGAELERLTLTVTDVPNVDTTKAEIKDLAKNFGEPYTFWEIFRWVLLALVVAALAWVVVRLVKKHRNNESFLPTPATPPLPVDEQALRRLETLRTKELWQHGMLKEYHTELTDIVRQYLKDEYGIESAEMTSDQTMEAYRSCRGWSQNCDEKLRQILRTADMVKFAKHEPATYEHDLSMGNAVDFVKWNAQKRSENEKKEEQ